MSLKTSQGGENVVGQGYYNLHNWILMNMLRNDIGSP